MPSIRQHCYTILFRRKISLHCRSDSLFGIFFAVIEGTLEKIESGGDTDSSGLMVQVLGVFKGSDSLQNKLIKINFAENLNR